MQTLFYGSATSGSPEAPSRDDKAYTPVDAYTKFVSLLRVREDRRTGVITVSLSWTDPEQAAEWLNDLIARLNVEMRRRAVEVSDRNLRYLTEQIGKAEVIELREALFRLTEAEITRSMLAKVQPEYAFRVIDQALAPPEDDYVWPSYPLFGAAGAALGLLTGLIVLAIRRSAITSP